MEQTERVSTSVTGLRFTLKKDNRLEIVKYVKNRASEPFDTSLQHPNFYGKAYLNIQMVEVTNETSCATTEALLFAKWVQKQICTFDKLKTLHVQNVAFTGEELAKCVGQNVQELELDEVHVYNGSVNLPNRVHFVTHDLSKILIALKLKKITTLTLRGCGMFSHEACVKFTRNLPITLTHFTVDGIQLTLDFFRLLSENCDLVCLKALNFFHVTNDPRILPYLDKIMYWNEITKLGLVFKDNPTDWLCTKNVPELEVNEPVDEKLREHCETHDITVYTHAEHSDICTNC